MIDPNRPYVYLKFDHIAKGIPRSEDQPTARIWLRLVNNSRVPILVYASGVPDGSPKDEVGVMDEVVPDLDSGVILGGPIPLTPFVMEQKPPAKDQSEMPGGYMFDVGTDVRIPPGKSILFSLPVSHLGKKRREGKNWHVEIPFEFALPEGKAPRDPVVGGQPRMVIVYSIWDIPDKYAEEIGH